MTPPEPPDQERPEEQAPGDRWRTVQPLPNWRKQTRRTGLLSRYPALGIGLVVLLAAGVILGVVGALRSRDKTSAAGSIGGVLQVAVVGLPSLDPAEARDPTAVMVVDQLFDTLVRMTRNDLEPVPGLAASVEANDEQTVFTFHLAPGARFDDDTPITAADVKFTLERIAMKGSQSPLAAQLEGVKGFDAYHRAGTATDLAGIETPDAATVVVRLDEPHAGFPSVLAHPGFGIVPKAAVERLGEAFRQTPVGSGPFRRVEPTGSGRLSLRRAPAHAPQARVDGIDFVDFPDADAAFAAFEKGEVDIAPVPPARVRYAAREFGREGMGPYAGVVFYGLNLKSPDLADRRFREAISLAIDHGEIIDDVYQGGAAPATGIVADGVPLRDGDACGDRCRHDPDRARELLIEAFPTRDIPEVTIDYDDDPTQSAVAAKIKTELDTVGIPTVLRPHSFADYGQFLVSGQHELFRLGWIADNLSPDGFLVPLFSSSSPDNLTGLANKEVDAKLAAARAEPDPRKRLALYMEAEQLVLEQYVVIPVAQLENRMVASSRVQDWVLDGLGTFDGAAVSVARK